MNRTKQHPPIWWTMPAHVRGPYKRQIIHHTVVAVPLSEALAGDWGDCGFVKPTTPALPLPLAAGLATRPFRAPNCGDPVRLPQRLDSTLGECLRMSSECFDRRGLDRYDD